MEEYEASLQFGDESERSDAEAKEAVSRQEEEEKNLSDSLPELPDEPASGEESVTRSSVRRKIDRLKKRFNGPQDELDFSAEDSARDV